MASATLDAKSQIGAPSMVSPRMNLDAQMAQHFFFETNFDSTARWVTYVFGSIVENAHCQHVFNATLAYHLQ